MGNTLVHQKHLLYTALMFYTRIRVPKDTPYSEELLSESRKYFTTIGILIGLIACFVFLLSNALLPVSISVLLSMISTILATGAFHEDGFADTCDSFGGGWQADQVLSIMKDSRIGTYGTVGLIGILSLKFCVLYHLALLGPTIWCVCVLCAHSVSRLQSSRMIKHYPYVSDTDKSKAKPIANGSLSRNAENFNLLVGIAPCALLAFYSITASLLGILFSVIVANLFMKYSLDRIGGYTGDVLGSIQQLAEVTFLISCLGLITGLITT